jgi:hypothetical protein
MEINVRIPGVIAWIAALVIGFPGSGLTGSGEAMNREVAYLLHAIETSGCVFVRNDVPYTAGEAVDHIRKKYNHLREKIGSTEEFIELCATQSSMSGKPYLIKCGDSKAVSSRSWLEEKLVDYRGESWDR